MENLKKQIEGFPGYEIDSSGNVWSYKRSKFGLPTKMTFKKTHDGYRVIELSNKGIRKNFRVNRLVAMHFIPNILNKPEVAHINGVKGDNRINNLYWATREENVADKFRHGSHAACEKHGKAKLSNEKVRLIRLLSTDFRWSLAKIYKIFGKIWLVTKPTIWRASKSINWKY